MANKSKKIENKKEVIESILPSYIENTDKEWEIADGANNYIRKEIIQKAREKFGINL